MEWKVQDTKSWSAGWSREFLLFWKKFSFLLWCDFILLSHPPCPPPELRIICLRVPKWFIWVREGTFLLVLWVIFLFPLSFLFCWDSQFLLFHLWRHAVVMSSHLSLHWLCDGLAHKGLCGCTRKYKPCWIYQVRLLIISKCQNSKCRRQPMLEGRDTGALNRRTNDNFPLSS